MAEYVNIINDYTTVIDDTFHNLALVRKERHYFPPNEPGLTYYSRSFDIDTTGIENPLVAFSSVCATAYYGMSPNSVTLSVTASNQQGVPNAVANLNDPTKYLDVYIFGKPKDNTPNVGMKIWDEQGKLVFDANHKYMRPYRTYIENVNYTPSNSNMRNVSLTFDSNKTYAVFPLGRMFYGSVVTPDVNIYSSVCAVVGNTAYISSGIVGYEADDFGFGWGVCKHRYFFIDVTGY